MQPPERDDAEAPLLDYHQKKDVGLHGKPPAVEMYSEAKLQLELGVPVILMGALDYSVQIISVAFVGRLGSLNLAGAAMAASFANVFGFAILEGLSGGMETSGGQAHGAGQSILLGYLLQRGQVVLVGFALPISLLWLQAAWVLRHWGQESEIAALAGQYVLYLLPGLFATAFFLPVAKFLQVQGITKPLAYIACTVLIFHAPMCWLYIHILNLGFVGAALATSTSNVVTLVLLVLYLNVERTGILDRTWPGFSMAAFSNLGPFMALALPACAMTSFEWWVFEIIQIMAGWLPHPDITVSAMTICFQTTGMCFMVPLGLSIAGSIRVSNELGAQRPGRARSAVIVAMTLATAAGGLLSILLRIFQNKWSSLFTGSETDVLQLVLYLMPSVESSMIAISWSVILSGVLRGSGQQVAGTVINTAALYGFSLPLAYVMGIKLQMGLEGLWWGLMIGITIQVAGQIFLTARTNWEYQAIRALVTVNSNSDQTQTKSIIY